jgi:putative DNA primase/helicase
MSAVTAVTDVPAPELGRVLDEVHDWIRRFVNVKEDQANLLTLWAAHTHARFDPPNHTYTHTPYLWITSPTMRSGKTLLMEVVGTVCQRPELASGITPAALYRTVEAVRPTLLIDEIDQAGGMSNRMRQVLNGGFRHDGNVRVSGRNGEVLQYSTFCPKALAGIGEESLSPTVRDRSVMIRLLRGTARERFRDRHHGGDARQLHRLLQFVMSTHQETLANTEPDEIRGLNPRQQDIADPLLQSPTSPGDVGHTRRHRPFTG